MESRGRSSMLLVVLLCCAAICCSPGGISPSPADGRIADHAYVNSYFDFSLTLPSAWSVPPKEAQAQMMVGGKAALTGDDAIRKAAVETSLKSSYQLLMANKYPAGAPVPFNPGIVIMAERVSQLPGITSGKDYLFHVTQLLTTRQLGYKNLPEAHPISIGGKEFYRVDFDLEKPTMVIKQSYLATLVKGYALAIVITGVDSKDMEELERIVTSIHFG